MPHAKSEATRPEPAPAPHPEPAPELAIALALLEAARHHGAVLAILRSAPRLARIVALASAMADGTEILSLPAWDVLPYDRVPPSPAAVGRRVDTLVTLATPRGATPRGAAPRDPDLQDSAARPRLILTTAAGTLIRVRPPRAWDGASLTLETGAPLDLDALRAGLAERGYHWDERVDEPGEVALRGQAVDIFPAGYTEPVRLDLDDDGRIAAIRLYDPLTQRTTRDLDRVTLTPAVEYPLDPDEHDAAVAALDAEAWSNPEFEPAPLAAEIAQPNQRLVPVFDYMPGIAWWADAEVPDRWAAFAETIADAYAATAAARRANPDTPIPPRPARLYLTAAQAQAALTCSPLRLEPDGTAVPAPARIAELMDRAQTASAAGRAVIIATPSEPARVLKSLASRGLDARLAETWADATTIDTASRRPAILQLDTPTGLDRPDLLILPIGPLLRAPTPAVGMRGLFAASDAPRCGDTVVHEDHGVATLQDLRLVETAGLTEERIALHYADGAELLVPTADLDRLWRYGSSEGRIPLDRIGGDAWRRKREEMQAEIEATATSLAAAAITRAATKAPVFDPPAAELAALARRFPYPLTRDQRTATDAVAADLRSGRPMDRLLCGDVGFGKTEIALRAAAIVALAGHQVLIAAPTTVLARQHLDTVTARFAGTAIVVAGLVRGADTPEGRATRRGLRDGTIHIVVGTQGLASEKIRFARLGLAIIDEEQRFGEADKARLAAPHKLVMTATPIPRTLQSALVGLRDVGTLATAPAHRQPTRTFVLPWEPALIRDALLRERRRGGQSFVVCPRIADLQALQPVLADLVPELQVITAHGRLKPEALEAAVLRFAAGGGDVLLATNIIEAGLDIPRANLMLVTDADRFGLAQLHQLRGRVGRSARRGAAYFLTAPGKKLAPATTRRLRTMEALSGLGAGIAIAAADLDGRGAGDLFGETQAGHVRAVGTGLYEHLLATAVATRNGTSPAAQRPDLHTGLSGYIPAAYIPEPDLRLSLYNRLARMTDPQALAAFTDELADRFGPCPPPLAALLAVNRLRLACVTQGITRLDAGPRGTALTTPEPAPLAKRLGAQLKDGRILLPTTGKDPSEIVTHLAALLA